MSVRDHAHVVLVVEDDDRSRETLAELLRLDGFIVMMAADGEEALDKLHAGVEPYLILLDLAMPRKTGVEFRREQQTHPVFSRYPVAVMSGQEDVREQARRMDVHDVLRKPVDPEDVLAIVERHCDRPGR